MKLEADKNVFKTVFESISRISEINFMTLGIELMRILLHIVIKKFTPKIPGPLIVVVISILIVYVNQLQLVGVKK